MYIPLKFTSESEAFELSNKICSIGGRLTENRVLILSPTNQEIVSGGIILPSSRGEDTVPNKGVVISIGEITEEYRTYHDLIQIGNVVTYGKYAGKEVNFDPQLVGELGDYKFTILSLNEILFTENNPNQIK